MTNHPQMLSSVLSLHRLHAVQHSIVAYHHYIRYTTPWIAVAVGMLAFIIMAVSLHHSTVRDYYAIYHPLRLSNEKSWRLPVAFGFAMGVIMSLGTLVGTRIGAPASNIVTTSQVGKSYRVRPTRYLREAVHYRTKTLPGLTKRLDRVQTEYHNDKRPTDLEKKTEPQYVHDEKQKIVYYKNFVNRASQLKINWEDYL